MGEILRPVFKNYRENKDVEKRQDKNDKLKAEHIEYFLQLEKSGNSEKLSNLFVPFNLYLEKFKQASEYTNDRLINSLKEEHKQKWEKNPAFSKAIFFELQARIEREKDKEKLSEE
ncbi:MAG: hypothetical protein Q7T79_02060 [bacterium]|nr:hypothetical protein [bacterium]